MPAKAAAPATTTSEPTVSVSEAMGLPKDWSLQGSLDGTDSNKPAAVETEEEDNALPGEENDVETTETTIEETTEGAGEKPDVEKPAEKPTEKPAAKTTAKSAKKTDKPETKATEKPAAKPAPKTTEKPAEEKPAAPAKIKVGGKEYTQEELEQKFAAADKPVVKPVVTDTPKEPTAEEKEAKVKETKAKDEEWIAGAAKAIDATLDETTLDTILAGGPDAVKKMQELRQTDMARSILAARKSMYADLQPLLDDIRTRQAPLVDQQMKDADEKEWNTFSTDNPELTRYRKAVEAIGHAMVEREGSRVKTLTMDQFRAEVATRTKQMLLDDLGIDADATYKTQQEAAAAAGGAEGETTTDKPAAEKLAAKPAAKPEVKRALVKPPGANPPVATPAKGGKGGGGDGDIIASLW